MAESVSTSYWHATAPAPIPDDPIPSGADVVVIGAGLLGTWTAYWLARAGVDVLVIEKTAISHGATGRNGGFLRGGTAAGYRHAIDTLGHEVARGLWQTTFRGQQLAAEIIAEEGIDCDFRTPGTLSLALNEQEAAEYQAELALFAQDGFPGEWLNHADVQAMLQTRLADDVAGALFFADGSLLHSSRYLAGIAAAAKRHGARFALAEAASLEPAASGVSIRTSAGTIAAGRVVVALNAWTDTLVPALSGLVVPVRGQILAYEPIGRVFEPGIGASISSTGEYWQQTRDGSIVIGGCRADAPGGDVGVREMVPTPDVTARIEAVIPRLFPDLTGTPVARHWAGLMAFTSDYLPVADAIPDVPGAWVTGGFCGHGMPYGPIVGQLLAEAVQTGSTPEALAPLRIARPSLMRMAS